VQPVVQEGATAAALGLQHKVPAQQPCSPVLLLPSLQAWALLVQALPCQLPWQWVQWAGAL
jgi:hypothetical protein